MGEDQLLNANIGSGSGHAFAQLIDAPRYKPEGRGVDSRWGSLTSTVAVCMVTAVPISCADSPGTVNLLDRVWRGIAFCVIITYTSVVIIIIIFIIIIINILTAIGLAPGGSSPVHICREHYIEYTNNTQNT